MTIITVGHQRFGIKTDPRTGTPCISSIHPYDETEYHWARRDASKSGTPTWKVYRDGRYRYTITVEPHFVNQGQTEEEYVARRLLKADREAHLTRTGGIW